MLQPLSDEEYQSETIFLKTWYQQDQVISEYLTNLLEVPKTTQDLVDHLQSAIDVTEYIKATDFLEVTKNRLFIYICTQCVCDLSQYRELANPNLRTQVSSFLKILGFGPVDLRLAAVKEPLSSDNPKTILDSKSSKMPDDPKQKLLSFKEVKDFITLDYDGARFRTAFNSFLSQCDIAWKLCDAEDKTILLQYIFTRITGAASIEISGQSYQT